MSKPVLTIDGATFNDLEGFYDEVSRKLLSGIAWGRNLAAFNDILRGGFGTPEGGFTLRWLNASLSRSSLGYPETIRFLRWKRQHCHPSNIASVDEELGSASRGEGQTLFEILVEIVQAHGPSGIEAEDNVTLELM